MHMIGWLVQVAHVQVEASVHLPLVGLFSTPKQAPNNAAFKYVYKCLSQNSDIHAVASNVSSAWQSLYVVCNRANPSEPARDKTPNGLSTT
jgi:hypothetical protein